MGDKKLGNVFMSGESKAEREKLLAEAHRINYKLRSTFFLRKLREYKSLSLLNLISSFESVEETYDWSSLQELNISSVAFNTILHSNISPLRVFCHPKILQERSDLVAYYRNIAALSQKSVVYLSSLNVKKFEHSVNSKSKKIGDDVSQKLAKLFNEHISLIIESALGKIEKEELNALYFASTGAQIDGSWRNAIGGEAENIVKSMLIEHCISLNSLRAFITNDKSSLMKLEEAPADFISAHINEIRGFIVDGAFKGSVLFSSEPDISLIDSRGKLKLVIEVKGGADPAGALERYGAAKKSFDNELNKNKGLSTMLVASCFTEEVLSRLDGEIQRSVSPIHKYYNLTRIIGDSNKEKLDFVMTVMSHLKT